MVALNRFISLLGEWGLPFKLLKHHDKFQWTEEAKQALQISSIICSRRHPGGSLTRREPATLHRRDYSRRQYGNSGGTPGGRPRLWGPATSLHHQRNPFESKIRYLTIQKLLYSILITYRNLRHYFDPYNILVVSNFPLAIPPQSGPHRAHLQVGSEAGSPHPQL
jgi:hypothetical protein